MEERAGRPTNQPQVYGDNPYEALAIAVVKQACTDYRGILRKKKLQPTDEWRLSELKQFFLGKTIKMYTTIDGKWLMKQLENQVEAEKAKKKAKKNPKRPKDAQK